VAQGLGASIFPHELTAESLRKAVEELIDSPQVTRNLKKFQLILAKRRDPAEQGADLLLEYARRDGVAGLHTGWFPTSPVVLEEVACDLCGETQNQPERKIEDALLASKHVYTTVRCKKCGLVYCCPRSNQTSHWLLEPLEHGRNSPRNMAKMRHGAELRTIRRLATVDLQSRVLVAGCGAGQFAQYLLERVGCETLCVEEHPALVRRARARGLLAKKGALGDLPDEDTGFDLVLFLETLERTLSPKSTLASARERLARGGRLIIKTVDGAKRATAIDVPRALYLFTANTLDAMLQQTGFTEIRYLKSRRGNHVRCTAIPEVQ
jgi:2-polyprenyl-3-methyl-5-hydroxy-6-metoxy-1,4-benzoquinol methylase